VDGLVHEHRHPHKEASMSISKVTAGEHVPHEFNVIIEIPMNADPSNMKWPRHPARCSSTAS
jgi:hypothetical protein